MYIHMCIHPYILHVCLPYPPRVGGQFSLYGEPLIKACIASKCDYIDVTGEPYVSVQVAMENSMGGVM